MGIHTATATRIIVRVSDALATLQPQYIKMREGQRLQNTQNRFFELATFPRVIGAIDCTHVKVQFCNHSANTE